MDPKLFVLCKEVLQSNCCIESIILCGSKATTRETEKLGVTSDYDVVVVMKTQVVPVYLRRLKAVGRRLSRELDVKLSLNPLPTFRIRRAKGNFFLFKLKREGVTLYGKDCIRELNPGNVRDIGVDWYFSYLSSLMRDLVQNFDPDFIHSGINDAQRKQLVYDASKALLGCGELLLLILGNYVATSEEAISMLSEYIHEIREPGAELSESLLEELRLAQILKRDPSPSSIDPLRLWFLTRDRLLEIFRKLMQRFINTNGFSLDELAERYLKSAHKSPLKNLEYLILTSLMRREIFPRTLFSRYLVINRIRSALIWLLLSIDENGDVDRETLEKSYRTLRGYMPVQPLKDAMKFWRHLRNVICTYWPYACTVMGI